MFTLKNEAPPTIFHTEHIKNCLLTLGSGNLFFAMKDKIIRI